MRRRSGKQPPLSYLISALTEAVGAGHVLTSIAATRRYRQGYRYGGGPAIAVVRPGSLVEQWRVVAACVAADVTIIMQAANTGLTGGSTPNGDGYPNGVLIFSTTRIAGVHLIDGGIEHRFQRRPTSIGNHNRMPEKVVPISIDLTPDMHFKLIEEVYLRAKITVDSAQWDVCLGCYVAQRCALKPAASKELKRAFTQPPNGFGLRAETRQNRGGRGCGSLFQCSLSWPQDVPRFRGTSSASCVKTSLLSIRCAGCASSVDN